uniref:Ribosomal protein L7Ae/L30e/S12e/Gadd45 domain-containing protein n=1 Tax=Romanomermis culicivorax TaxID=13658 RepID=A0A915K139_ROMCU
MSIVFNINAPIFIPSRFKSGKYRDEKDSSSTSTWNSCNKGVQVDTEVKIDSGFLVISNYEEFWTAYVRHVGLQTSFVPTNQLYPTLQQFQNFNEIRQSDSIRYRILNVPQKIQENNRPKKPSTVTLSDFVVQADQRPSCSKNSNHVVPKVSADQKAEIIRGNVLDASEPVYHKGKTRNKVKKPSKLKKIILEERENSDSQNLVNTGKKLKAKIRRRLVKGLQETLKMMKVEKVKLVILTPDIEDVSAEGGLNQLIREILDECQKQNVSYVFGLSRWKLGRVVKKYGPVGCVGILNYQGAEQCVSKILELLAINRDLFFDTNHFASLNLDSALLSDPGNMYCYAMTLGVIFYLGIGLLLAWAIVIIILVRHYWWDWLLTCCGCRKKSKNPSSSSSNPVVHDTLESVQIATSATAQETVKIVDFIVPENHQKHRLSKNREIFDAYDHTDCVLPKGSLLARQFSQQICDKDEILKKRRQQQMSKMFSLQGSQMAEILLLQQQQQLRQNHQRQILRHKTLSETNSLPMTVAEDSTIENPNVQEMRKFLKPLQYRSESTRLTAER